jgi:hypothetical protein
MFADFSEKNLKKLLSLRGEGVKRTMRIKNICAYLFYFPFFQFIVSVYRIFYNLLHLVAFDDE